MTSAPFRHILFATDFSSGAAIAREEAVRLAHRWGAKLSMIHVLEQVTALREWVGAHPEAISVATLSEQMERSMVNETGYIEGLEVVTEVLEGDDKAHVEINRYAAEHQCDLLVIACHRHAGLKAAVRGSSATSLIRTAEIPVLSVRPDASPGYDAVLAPVDYGHDSEAALNLAIEMASQADVPDLTILHAFEVPGIGSIRAVSEASSFFAAVSEQETASLRAFVSRFDMRGLEPRLVVEHGTPHRVVANYTEHNPKIDLIVMGTKGRKGLGGFLLGNTAERVLSFTQATTMTLRVSE